eukprot:c6218_g1_i1.p1 GENE.c6218_g1_i1~~c6218_g1_i1.p1  ORF type:complete len:203 (-),score=63.96 c6218_g1_i1:3-611(-)
MIRLAISQNDCFGSSCADDVCGGGVGGVGGTEGEINLSEFDKLFGLNSNLFTDVQEFIDSCPQANSKDLLLMPSSSRLRRILLSERGEEWVKYCMSQQVCVDQIYSVCQKPGCEMIHIDNFGKEELFFRTARCWKYSVCETRHTTCRFWHDFSDGEKRVAQQNIAEALIKQGKARCTCGDTWQSCFYCLKCQNSFTERRVSV